MSKAAFFLLLFLALGVPVQAAPGPPTVKFPTGNAAWNIDITHHEQPPAGNSASGKPVEPVRIEVVRTGPISHYHITWSNQKITDDWLNGKYAIYTNPISGITLCSPLVGDVNITVKYPTYDQASFSWVSSSELIGPTTYQGISCVQVKKVKMQAWLDAKTDRPVAMDDGAALYVYTFPPPPLPVAVMPKEYVDYLVRYENALKPPQAWGNVRSTPQ